MSSKFTAWLLCLIVFGACTKKVEQPIVDDEPASTNAWNAQSFLSGGTSSVIQFENGKQLHALEKNALLIVDGDIIMAPWQIDELRKINSTSSRSFLKPYVHHWKGGIVPYVINSGLSPNDRNKIENAIANWQRLTTLNFVVRTAENAGMYGDYVEFVASWGNSSNLGKVGGQQLIHLYVDPYYGVHLTAVTHEIGHAIGLLHEHARADRGNFITVNWSNIQPYMQHNFLSWAEQGLPGTDVGPFDFNSIMLYPSHVDDLNFVYNPSIPAMQRLDGSTWGWNFVLSAGDADASSLIYGPPYARLDYVNLANERQWSWMLVTEHVVDNIYLRLFADEQCTIPYAPPVDKYVDLHYTETVNGITASNIASIKIPAWHTNVVVQSSFLSREFRSEWGAVVKDETRKYQPHAASFRN